MPIIKSILAIAASLLNLFVPTTYVEGAVGQPQNINPLASQENPVDRDLAQLVFRGLTELDSEGNIQPGLAASWEISEDGLEYTFKLADARWHDGKIVTASDVTYTASKTPVFKEITVEELDGRTVKMTLKDPFAPFLRLLTLGIIPKHGADRIGALSPIGSGAYQLTSVERGTRKIESVTLRKFLKNEPGPERIVFRFFETEPELEMAAKLGELDGFEADNFTWDTYQNQTVPLRSRYFAVFFNLREKDPLKDPSFRQAVAARTSRERIISEIGGFGEAVENPISGTWAAGDIKSYPYAETPAEQFEGELNLVFPDSLEHQKTAAIIKEEWEKTGVTINLIPQKMSQIKEETLPERRFDLLLLGQEASRDPDRYVLWHSTQIDFPGLNLSGWRNMRADRALEEGRKTMEAEKREEHYANFQTVFAEELPAILLYQPTYQYHQRKRIGNLNLEGIFTRDERWALILAQYP